MENRTTKNRPMNKRKRYISKCWIFWGNNCLFQNIIFWIYKSSMFTKTQLQNILCDWYETVFVSPASRVIDWDTCSVHGTVLVAWIASHWMADVQRSRNRFCRLRRESFKGRRAAFTEPFLPRLRRLSLYSRRLAFTEPCCLACVKSWIVRRAAFTIYVVAVC